MAVVAVLPRVAAVDWIQEYNGNEQGGCSAAVVVVAVVDIVAAGCVADDDDMVVAGDIDKDKAEDAQLDDVLHDGP